MPDKLQPDTWYWISHPHEGDIFYPIKSIGGGLVMLDGAKVHQDTIGQVNWHDANMPETGQDIEAVQPDELPTYQTKATSEQREETRQWLGQQLRGVIRQEKMGTPSEFLKVRCGCNKFVQWHYMYRCLYCGVWFCKECAEKHFGMKVDEGLMNIHTLPIRLAMQASNKIKVPVYRALRDDGLHAKWESVPAGEQHWNGNVWIFGVSVVWDLVAIGLKS